MPVDLDNERLHTQALKTVQETLKMTWSVRTISLLPLIVVAISACARAPEATMPVKVDSQPVPSPEAPAVSTPIATPPPEAAPPASASCPWLAVVIDNHVHSRPQSGVSQASIVYELPTEGRITRLLAFFCNGDPEVVGPVRSLRTFMLQIAREYHATVAHAGHSDSALEVLRQGTDPVINQFWQPKPFWRDWRRRMPHNLYTSVPSLHRYIRRPPASAPDHWTTGEIMSASHAMMIDIPYGPGYDVRFAYDPSTNRYRRLVAGHSAIDALTGEPITVDSVIVQYARWWQTFEGPVLTSRLELMGSGRITVFTAGRRIDGRWRRVEPQQPTVFEDSEGVPLQLQTGPVWVSVVPDDRIVQVSIPRQPSEPR